MLRLIMAVAACTTIRCNSGFVTDSQTTLPDAFAGTWRSVTPTTEFVRLSVFSTSGDACAVAARLTFSGVAWEGSGRLVGDSLVLHMAAAGSAAPTSTVILHPSDARTVRVQVRPEGGATLDLTFVREDN